MKDNFSTDQERGQGRRWSSGSNAREACITCLRSPPAMWPSRRGWGLGTPELGDRQEA